MFRVGICIDETNSRKQLEQFLIKLSKTTSYSFEIKLFSSGESLIQYYRDHGSYAFHILILGIVLEGMSGIETARYIRLIPDRDVQIIFFTSHPEYMLESFEVQPFQFLLKPISYDIFKNNMVSICNYIISSVSRFLTVKTEEGQTVIKTSDIIGLIKIKQTLTQNKIKVITADQQYIISGTLHEYLKKLSYPFLLIHRSVIINLEHVHRFNASYVVMSNNDQMPITRAYVKQLKSIYALYMLNHFREYSR
ncbi:LytTR family DNA-binding domain-containing protein [Paenibacillus sp. J22TS3]|uniref:LytR/AlgR family response regulator transcription factor n=1 Tax=Paenibacillus sp. J22TS3 TaxID=2807192 RepID=UPI001B18948D|nr:LytTR family DNA-binding domain-containing protein [Paenibacillus sp. J22TS3]GIP21122.1 DNA-binding response regulator [Paenibacillus sp. J22TS3]